MDTNIKNQFSIIGIIDGYNDNTAVISKIGDSIRVVAVMNREKIVSCDLFLEKENSNIVGFKSRDMYKFWFSDITSHAISDLPESVYWIPWKGRTLPEEGKVSKEDFKVTFEPFFLDDVQGTFGIGNSYGDLFYETEGSVYFGYKQGSDIYLLNEYAETDERLQLKGVNLNVNQEGAVSSKILTVSTIIGENPFRSAKKFKNDSFIQEVYKSLLDNKVANGILVTVTAKNFVPTQYTAFDTSFTIAVVRLLFLDQ